MTTARAEHGTLARSWLFVPGDRPDRFDTAHTRTADAVILDLEDAVDPEDKQSAREEVVTFLQGGGQAWVRVNGVDTPEWEQDCRAVRGTIGLLGVVLPKAESARAVGATAVATGTGVVPLVETATGIEAAPETARADATVRLALGSVDLATELGTEGAQALLYARSRLVYASAAARRPGPIDGPTVALDDPEVLAADLGRARELGFTATFCLHPRQVGPVNAAHAPDPAAVTRAQRIVEAAATAGGGGGRAVRVDGEMVDRPRLLAAQRLLDRQRAFAPRALTHPPENP